MHRNHISWCISAVKLGVNTMAYVPKWETLAAALQRLVGAGMTEGDAKRDLCQAIADGVIAIQVHVAAAPDLQLPAQAWSDDIPRPPRLSAEDFDWVKSRPLIPWPPLAERPYAEPMMLFLNRAWDRTNRTIELIEVSTSDVSRVLLGSSKDPGANAAGALVASKPSPMPDAELNAASVAAVLPLPPVTATDTGPPPRQRPNRGAKSQGIGLAIEALWPGHVIPPGLSAKDRDKQIVHQMRVAGYSIPGDPARAIQRYLREHRRSVSTAADISRHVATCR
jgi:hypothetical protein